MDWLLRYALHCEVALDHSLGAAYALRDYFGLPGWRLLFRSGKAPFLPILRNRELGFAGLMRYVGTLVRLGWKAAPSPVLLQFLVDQRYLYVGELRAKVPERENEFLLMKIASRHGKVSRREFSEVYQWEHQTGTPLHPRNSWKRLVERARIWRAESRVRVAGDGERWAFALQSARIGEFDVVALERSIELWEEQVAMSNCLFRLRRLCAGSGTSRFFSIRRGGRRIATAELQRRGGHDWFLRDCRLSFNRIPAPDVLGAAQELARLYGSAHVQAQAQAPPST